MLYNIYRHTRVGQAHSGVAEAKNKAQQSQRDVQMLEQKVEMLLMVTEALWSIVKNSHDLEDDDLKTMIDEIDLQDGKRDGKVGKSPPINCGQCGKPLTRGKTKCMYCGAENDVPLFKR